jgi:short-subunit dehydrogenase
VELRPANVRVVSFYPGVTESEFNRNLLTGDGSAHSKGRMRPTSAEQVGRAIVRAARREPRDAYATWFDRFFVFTAAVAPWLMDRMLARFFGTGIPEN